MEPKDRLQRARIDGGFPKAADAARAHRTINQHTLTSNENGNREISKKMAEVYGQAFGVSAAWILYGDTKNSLQGEVPLRGKVGAGSEVYVFDDDHPMDYVEAPPHATANTSALEVDGDSMFPVYEDRAIIYYSDNVTDPSVMLNKRCVVKLANGRILVKKLRRGTTDELWNLDSFNPAFPTMEDQIVEWVAKIDWVKER